MCACGEKNTEDFGLPLSVSTTSVDIPALGGQMAISVTSHTDWIARSSVSWLKLVTATGKGGDQPSSFMVQVDENKTTFERTATITVLNIGKESLEIGFTQAAGSGESTSGRGINNAEDLVAFAKAVNGEGSIAQYMVDGAVRINNDIDCSSITEWIPAGTEEMPLTYNINGNNKTLYNINWKIDASASPHLGFIGYARNVTIGKLNFGSEGSRIEFTGEAEGKVRAGAIVGYGVGLTMEKVTNNADLTVTGTGATGNNLIVGGLVGYMDSASSIGGTLKAKGCVNNGDITVSVAGQEGGLVGYNAGVIRNCSNYGTITGPSDGTYGPGWLCSYNTSKSKVKENYGYGFVGSTPAMMRNSMMNCETAYALEENTVDWTLDAYYDWEEVESKQLHPGAVYHHYSCTNVPRQVRVLEIDLTNPGIEITQAFAGEIVPNPNWIGSNDNNNGFKLRERLSDVCSRRRSEGQKILAGVNCCFFDSNDGFPRGHVVEEGEPIFINNPAVVSKLPNHAWAFTVFEDGTASCGVKKFSGKMKAGGKEYSYSSVNDTILRHASPNYQANLFTSRYVYKPYPGEPDNHVNPLAKNVLYVVCEYTGANMTVNTGYAAATVVEVLDGRATPLTNLPYQTSKKRVVVALSGDMASEWSTFIQPGATVEFKCDMAIDEDASKPIHTLASTMYQIMRDGEDASNTPGPDASLYSKFDPKTFPVVSQDGTRVWLVEIDGRQVSNGWYSLGVKGYEMYRIAKKLGGWWVTGMDGGGSSSIWVYDASKGSGSIVSKPCDSRGERSCMNYILIREK